MQNMKQSRIDNLFTLVRRYSSKRHSSFLHYHTKLSHCHVDVTATVVGVDLGPCQVSMMNFFFTRTLIIE